MIFSDSPFSAFPFPLPVFYSPLCFAQHAPTYIYFASASAFFFLPMFSLLLICVSLRSILRLQADVALRNASSFYTYSKTRGLFAGISLEGSCFVERKGANRKYVRMSNLVNLSHLVCVLSEVVCLNGSHAAIRARSWQALWWSGAGA